MKNKFSLLICATVLLFSACSTDFEVTGDWKETMVIYGLLDQSQAKQYIKINKAFLGEGNAFTYAQVKDSVQFPNVLTVTLQRIKSGNVTGAPILLTRDSSIPKDPGTFYSDDQANAIYSFKSLGTGTDVFPLFDDSQYKLTVRNSETGKEASAITVLVKDGTMTSPAPTAMNFSFISPGNVNYRFPIKLNSGVNARLYKVLLRFHFTDSTTTGNVADSVDWSFPQLTTGGLGGGEVLDFGFVGQEFMKHVGNSLTENPTVLARIAGKVDIFVIAAADELNTFINVNKPSTSIVQERPEYTNITNGLGIFSARYYKAPFSRSLNVVTLDTLSGGYNTCRFKFLNAAGIWTGCH